MTERRVEVIKPMSDWAPGTGYEVGQIISVPWLKPWWKVWLERLTTLRWHVRLIEYRRFKVTETAVGAVWPEVK